MTIAVVEQLFDISPEDYARVMGAIGATPPPGLIVSAAARDEENVRLVQVWASQQDYARFLADRVVPARRREGIGMPHRNHVEFAVDHLMVSPPAPG